MVYISVQLTKGSNSHLIAPQSPGVFLSHQGLASCDSIFSFCFFKLWCWKRVLRVPWTVKRSNQLILNEINPEYSLEGLMLKLKLQYFGHLMWTADSLEKTLMLGKIESRRRRGRQDEKVGWPHQLDGHEFEQTTGDSEGHRSLVCCCSWGHGNRTWLSD